MKGTMIFRVLIALAIYLLIVFFLGEWGRLVLYPVTLLVTSLHEMGHALFALISGGGVSALQINQDGSGHCVTTGGSAALTLMGGYIGSAIFGNLLFYLGAKKSWMTSIVLWGMAILMALAAIFWFSNLFTSILLLLFGTLLFYLNKSSLKHEIVLFMGLASIWHIIRDFNVGPSSDLQAYSQTIGIFGPDVWKYFWLFIVVSLTLLNLYWLFVKTKGSTPANPPAGKLTDTL